MNRCPHFFSRLRVLPATRRAWLALGVCLASTVAGAQVRPFPPAALRGTLEVTLPPTIVLDGKADRLSPGARIRSPQNLLVQPASLAGQTQEVNYLRDAQGLVHEVWLLTADELALKHNRAGGARNYSFGFEQPGK